MSGCKHSAEQVGVCPKCGVCEHEVVVNGCCAYCGETPLVRTVKADRAAGPANFVALDAVRRKKH